MYVVSFSFFHLKKWSAFHAKTVIKMEPDPSDRAKGKNQVPHSVRALPPLQKLITLHTELKLIETYVNQVGYILVPFLLFGGLGILVSMNFASIRMHTVIPMPYFLVIPFISIVLVLAIILLMPCASEIHEDSHNFLKQMSDLCCQKPHLLRRIKAQQTFRRNIGTLCIIKRSTVTTFMACTVDATIDVVLI